MAEGYSASCTMEDHAGQRSTVTLDLGTSLSGGLTDKSDNLRELLEAKSYAKCARRSDLEREYYEVKDLEEQEFGFDTVDQKAVLTFKSMDTHRTIKFSIPAPKKSLFEMTIKGIRVKESEGQSIANTLEDLYDITGDTLDFIEGKFYSKERKRD